MKLTQELALESYIHFALTSTGPGNAALLLLFHGKCPILGPK